jgi:hypothetical protein
MKLGNYVFKKYPYWTYTAVFKGSGSVVLTCFFSVVRLTQREFDGCLAIGLLDRKYS